MFNKKHNQIVKLREGRDEFKKRSVRLAEREQAFVDRIQLLEEALAPHCEFAFRVVPFNSGAGLRYAFLVRNETLDEQLPPSRSAFTTRKAAKRAAMDFIDGLTNEGWRTHP